MLRHHDTRTSTPLSRLALYTIEVCTSNHSEVRSLRRVKFYIGDTSWHNVVLDDIFVRANQIGD